MSPLMVAAELGDRSCMRRLLKQGARLDAVDKVMSIEDQTVLKIVVFNRMS